MAQSVRRPGTIIAKDRDSQRDKSRTSYFGNIKSRLGSKLPPGVSQPPQFAKNPWETQPKKDPWSQDQDRPISRPLDHVPHIRNPKLRQYYLQGTSWDINNTAVKHQDMEGASYDCTGITFMVWRDLDKEREPGSGCQSHPHNTMGKQSLFQSLYNKYNRKNIYSDFCSKGLPGDTVFTVRSQFNGTASSTLEEGKMGHHTTHFSSHLSSSGGDLIPRKGNGANIQGSSQLELDVDPHVKQTMEPGSDPWDTFITQPQSPPPESDYDKLLDVEAVPMPDGQLCLFALPPEFCEGEGPEAVQYLKLLCRYITDRKGVVSGILLVTSKKLFFDPCKTHPLVKEHGCEEYLLSCSVDNLMSVSFVSDISHVHFNTSLQRKKGKQILQQLKKQARGLLKQKDESVQSELAGLALSLTREVSREEEEADSRDMEEAERELDGVANNTATFCSEGQGTVSTQHAVETEPSETATQRKLSTCSAGGLMFVRLQFQLPSGKKRSPRALQIGSSKTPCKREVWLALSQESSDELHAHLTRSRPGLCILKGGEEEEEEEGGADREEEEFVLIKDKDEVEQEEEEVEEEEVCHRLRNPGEDWEMVLMEDSRDKLSLVLDRDPEGFGDILECTDILEASHVRELFKELPPRTIGHTWTLAYSTSHHGASLKTLYRKLSASDSPVLIVIKDALDEIFGAFLSHPLRPSETFYGTGETFLFMLHPRYKCFRWTGENSFFIKGDLDSFAIGGGSGHFGLWVDENLYLGRSSPCFTFNNCCLSETDDFRIMDLEAWTFG